MASGGQQFGFDRIASEALVAALAPGGVASSLITRRNVHPALYDVQLRKQHKSCASWASLYVGLTTILDLHERRSLYRLSADQTHRRAGTFDEQWRKWMSIDTLHDRWPDVEGYIERVTPLVSSHLTRNEGAVHAALCCGRSSHYSVINREANLWFVDRSTKNTVVGSIQDRLVAALMASNTGEAWWPGQSRPIRPFGTALDILAVDQAGRVLAIEAKPPNALAGITLGPVQVLLYAELFAQWMSADANAAATLRSMHHQRVDLGLSPPVDAHITSGAPIVPVLAIGAGQRSPAALDRLRSVAGALEALIWTPAIGPLEVWGLDEQGEVTSERIL